MGTKINLKGFRMILRESQLGLIDYLKDSLPSLYGNENIIANEDYVFAKGTLPVLLVAHLDTVHENNRGELPKEIFYEPEKRKLWSPTGIGGDDRCGVYALLNIITSRHQDKKALPSVLFPTFEEIGCVGSTVARKELKDHAKDFNFLIEIDRRGKDDVVYYSTYNPEFEKFIQEFGFTQKHGSNSDINGLSKAWGMASCNLSSGYYNEHTTDEIIVLGELEATIDKVKKILDTPDLKYYPMTTTVKTTTTSKAGKTDKNIVSLGSLYDADYWEEFYERYDRNKKADKKVKDLKSYIAEAITEEQFFYGTKK